MELPDLPRIYISDLRHDDMIRTWPDMLSCHWNATSTIQRVILGGWAFGSHWNGWN